jgi:adenosylcobinamide-phosphate synthase
MIELIYILGLAILFDCLLGDPQSKYHPVAIIGRTALTIEPVLKKTIGNNFGAGMCAAALIIVTAAVFAWGLASIALLFNTACGIIAAAVCVYISIAPRSLITHAQTIKNKLNSSDIKGAQDKLSMIVSRDTSVLDERGIIRSCVESLGENVIDAVTSAIFYAAIGWLCYGIPGAAAAALFYRASNTLDATYGYRNERYQYFGTFAARLDDCLNFIPARLTLCAIFLAAIFGFMRPLNAVKYAWLDHDKHPSPNSNWGMAAFAGALGVKLGGPTFYHGKWESYPYWGEEIEPLTIKHIGKAQLLVALTTIFFTFLCLFIILIFRSCNG